MRVRSNSREKAETVRKRGFGLSRSVLSISLVFTLVISVYPHDDMITGAKAEAVLPVAAGGAAAAAAAALGVTETEFIIGLIGALAISTGIVYDTTQMSAHFLSDGTVDSSYWQDAVEWKEHGIDVPSWGDLSPQTKDEFDGNAWNYDSAVWYEMVTSLYGMSDLGGGGDNDPNNNKKWNFIKALATKDAAVPLADTISILSAAMFSNMFGDYGTNWGIIPTDKGTLDGLPWWTAVYSFPDTTATDATTGNTFTQNYMLPYNWGYMLRMTEYYGETVLYSRFIYYLGSVQDQNIKNIALNKLSNGYRYYQKEGPGSDGTERRVIIDEETGQFYADKGIATWPSVTQINVGSNVIANANGTYTTVEMYLNSKYAKYYKIYEDGVVIDEVLNGYSDSYDHVTNVDYGQTLDFPLALAEAIYKNHPNEYLDYLASLLPDDENKVLTIVNPYQDGETSPDWLDFLKEKTSGTVQPLPDDPPSEDPYPTPEPDPDEPASYPERIERIMGLAFGNVFPFCLISDLKRLSDKVVVAGNSADFSLYIPLASFNVPGMDHINLDANYSASGGGLIDLGNYTRPFFTLLFIALLLGLSIKLFLR